MDILTEPNDAAPRILVPLAHTILPYDDQGFRSFGDRNGFSSDSVSELSPGEIASHLQSWLFFGLLSEALPGHFNMEDYICISDSEPQRRYLSLRNLPSRVSSCEKARDKVDEIRDYCFLAADSISELESAGHLGTSPAGETALAILVLAQSLLTVTEVDGPPLEATTSFVWGSSFLRRFMEKGGWCPQQVSYITDTYDPLVACFLARLRRPASPSHSSCTKTTCVANNVRLDSKYQQRHVADDCRCEAVAVDANDVKGIILRGGIPLVSVQRGKDGRVSLAVTEATSSTTYTALSHVWSDGLGNPTANAVPRCQLEMISNSLSQLSEEAIQPARGMLCGIQIEPVDDSRQEATETPSHFWGASSRKSPLFWLDTLCIPVSAPDAPRHVIDEFNEVRVKAINQMAQVYAMASQVFVLDSELQRIKADTSKPFHDLEVLARLACCPWMFRCWTLQEGAIANKLVVRCAGGVFTPLLPLRKKRDAFDFPPGPAIYYWGWKMMRVMHRHITATTEAPIAARAAPIGTHVRYRLQETLSYVTGILQRGNTGHRVFGQAGPESQLNSFCRVWSNLAYRNTTMTEDLPAIFANLLDLNAYPILQTPPCDRMLALLRSIKILPVDLLFNTGPRRFAALDNDLRWIPSEPSQVKMCGSKGDFDGWGQIPFSMMGFREALKTDYNGRLRWTEGGHLEFSSGPVHDFALVMVKGTDSLGDTNPANFVIYMKNESGKEPIPLLVQLHYPDADALPRDVVNSDGKVRTATQRPHYDSLRLLVEVVLIILLPTLGLICLASIIIRAVIEVRLGWSNLSPLGRAATVVFALEAGGLTAQAIPPPIAQTLFIVDRMREVGSLSSLDKAYVIMSLVGNNWLLVGLMWLLRRGIMYWAYRIWLESFDQYWPEKAGLAWKVYSFMFRVTARILS
ncbi:uncharacterized protein DNG_03958 [Cephalotrichum gorgonifer]|uniref:Heterokaryon incompatibility domain-containing protein n=1 Tax=Cephalotrichum gorgonifer TaxID=2041049 RepID=A0AAE8MV50_9PEZI|nr:uncharacterized protein DNG_03958 [Cephalotrichum gorgonifer]